MNVRNKTLDALVAAHVFGLVEGQDFGEWPEHEWERLKNGSINIYSYDEYPHVGPRCTRCGYCYCRLCQDMPGEPCQREPRPYSEDDRYSMTVVRQMHQRGFRVSIGIYGRAEWQVEFAGPESNQFGRHVGSGLPEAICRAALQALGVAVPANA